MIVYVEKVFHKFRHPTPSKPQYLPFKFVNPTSGSKIQYVPDLDTSPLLHPSSKTRVQQIAGTFILYGSGIDTNIPLRLISYQLHSLSLHYLQITTSSIFLATYPPIPVSPSNITVVIWYSMFTVMHLFSVNLILRTEQEVFPLSNQSANLTKLSTQQSMINCSFHVECRLRVIVSVAEAEISGIFHNCQTSVLLCITFHELSHD